MNKHLFVKAVLIIFLIFTEGIVLAAQTEKPTSQDIRQSISEITSENQEDKTLHFDPLEASIVLNKISKGVVENQYSVNSLKSDVTQLSELRSKAQECVSNTLKELQSVNKYITELKEVTITNTSATPELNLVINKKLKSESLISECRLFVLHSSDMIDELNRKVDILAKEQLIQRERNIVVVISQGVAAFKNFLPQIDLESRFIKNNIFAFLGLFVIIFTCSQLLTTWLRKKFFKKRGSALDINHHVVEIIYKKLFLVILITLSAFNIGIASIFHWELFSINILIWTLLLYIFIDILLEVVFLYSLKYTNRNIVTKEKIKAIFLFARVLIITFLSCFVTYILFSYMQAPPAILQLITSINITLILIFLLIFLWMAQVFILIYIPQHFICNLVLIILTTFIFTVLISDWTGYHALATHLYTAAIYSIIFFILVKFLQKLISILVHNIQSADTHWAMRIRDTLRVKKFEIMPELILLEILFLIFLWGGYILYLFHLWGVSNQYTYKITMAFVEGFKISNITIYPLRITVAIILFSIFTIATRWLRNYIRRYPNLYMEYSSKEAISAIIGYIGFTIALLFGFIIAGVSFTGLAIIAGALSVGIGFGLQGIVNNFVSGIILLIERTIKIGDRIIVGTTEGYVKKVRIRYTQIHTLRQSDVIVPNSEMIAQQVTNFMFRDLHWRIEVPITIALGSNVDLAIKLLLEIAQEHPDVITEIPEEVPRVIFRKFGTYGIDLELFCIIRDVNKKSSVPSDLNRAIDKRFRDNNVEIPIPKQDIYIKSYPPKDHPDDQ